MSPTRPPRFLVGGTRTLLAALACWPLVSVGAPMGTPLGFTPGLRLLSLDPIEEGLPGDLDLSLACAGQVEDRAVLRVGTLLPWSDGQLELRAFDGHRLRLEGAHRLSWLAPAGDGWKTVATVRPDLRRERGAAVLELWLPAEWRGWTERLLVPAGLGLETRRNLLSPVADRLEARRDGERTDHHVAFVHHGNQGLTWTDVLWGDEAGAHEQHWADYLDTGSAHNGFDEVLGLHDLLNVPANFHVSGTLQSAAEWYYPDGVVEGWNDWLTRGVTEGWAGMLTSAYAQHIMPFVEDSMNDWSVHTHSRMTEWRYGYTPHVAWVPERVWVSPADNDGNPWDTSHHVVDWIGDDWLPHGVYGVLLDQEEHCDYANNWANDRHIYTIPVPGQGDLKVIPINGSFTGACHHDAGAAWNQILGASPDELLVYGTDWEVVAEVAGFAGQFPSALNNMIWLVQQIAASGGSVQSMKLDEALGGFGGGAINLQNGTYGLLGGRGGYGSDWLSPGTRNSWYGHFAGSPARSDQHSPQWNYGQVWNQTWSWIMGSPDNDLSTLAWYVLMTNLYETGWHDGAEISGWIHRYASHIKNARVYAEAGRWWGGQAWQGTGAQLADVDADGVEELVLHSDRVLAVFETVGGRAPWVFAKDSTDAASLVGSCSAYWVDTEGDYNDGSSNNHVAAFSDVSPLLENDLYSLAVDSLGSGFARVRLEHPSGLVKSFSLRQGEPWIQCDYDGPGETFVKSGFTPDYLDLLWNARTTRLWDPGASWPQSDWMGQRNTTTGWTAALVLGNGGARHNSDFQGTLVRGDEIAGDGRFRFLFYTGRTSAPDAQGQVAELVALAATDMDVKGPRLAESAPWLAPDMAVLDFDEAVDETSAETLANWSLTGFPAGVTLIAAERQAWPRRVQLRLAGLSGGMTGSFTATGVTDLAGNLVDPDHDTALFSMPNGLTPHTPLVDGAPDYFRSTELMEARADSLFLTWDSQALYVAYRGRNLATGDFFVHLDTDNVAGSGAPRDSWSRIGFTSARRPEFSIAVEGGGNSMQINRWTGTAWTYTAFGVHTGSSYEGWSGNLLTELRIPWSELGNPGQLAVCAGFTQENNQVTVVAWPQANPTGTNVTYSQWFLFTQPPLDGPMPLMGVAPNNPLTAAPAAPLAELSPLPDGTLRLSWTSVAGALSYRVYHMDEPWLEPGALPLATTPDNEIILTPPAPRGFYVVRASTQP
jgi:hypothetical protein